MPPKPRAAPQHPVGVPSKLWAQAVFLAEENEERDLIGAGVSALVRRLLRDEAKRHRKKLPPQLRD